MSNTYTNLTNLSLGSNGADAATFTSSAISVGAITCTSITNSGAISGTNVSASGYIAGAYAAATQAANIVALPCSKSLYRIAATISINLKGIAAGADGQLLDLFFKPAGSQTLTITPSSTAALAAAQILIMTTAASLVTTGRGFASFVYSSADSKWICKYLST